MPEAQVGGPIGGSHLRHHHVEQPPHGEHPVPGGERNHGPVPIRQHHPIAQRLEQHPKPLQSEQQQHRGNGEFPQEVARRGVAEGECQGDREPDDAGHRRQHPEQAAAGHSPADR